MQVYKTFFKVLRKYKMSLIMYSAIMIFMIWIFASESSSGSNDIVQKKYSLLVVDEDNSEISKEFVSYLGKKHTLDEGDYTDDQIKDMLFYENISEYIVIPKGFGETINSVIESKKNGKAVSEEDFENLLKGTYDDGMPRGIFINMQINQYLNAVTDYMASGENLEDASKRADEALDISEFTTFQEEETDDNAVKYTSFLVLPYGILSIIFSGVIPVIIAFNEKEKKNRTAVSSIKLTTRNISLILGAATVAFAVATIFIIVITLKNGGDFAFTNAWWLSVLNTFIYTITATLLLSMLTSFPILISKGSTNAASFLTVIIGLSFAFLGGTFVDLDILGEGVAKVGRFIPNYWYSIACKKIWYDGAGLTDLFGCYGLQLLFGLVCLTVGLAVTRYYGNKASA
ncbi:MAG: ABC transporter permease [Eubacterium sp.]|nr:ABC transporter permease [Eubacterium sp.]